VEVYHSLDWKENLKELQALAMKYMVFHGFPWFSGTFISSII